MTPIIRDGSDLQIGTEKNAARGPTRNQLYQDVSLSSTTIAALLAVLNPRFGTANFPAIGVLTIGNVPIVVPLFVFGPSL